jgi:uncharacterized membrane protein
MRRTPHPIHRQHEESLAILEKFAVKVNDVAGLPNTFVAVFLFNILWLMYNALAPKGWQFDPAPYYQLWLFLSNFVQLSLMFLFMVAQRLDTKKSDLRADLDYQTDKRAEKEVKALQESVDEVLKIIKSWQQELTSDPKNSVK